MEAMKSEVDEIALQGVEFWSTVCDEEVDLAIELSEVWNLVPQCIEKCSSYSIFRNGLILVLQF